MGKQIIRLTESDLHQMVKESVNKILSELDWRTYANASKKARERGNDELANDFNRHITSNSSRNEFSTPSGPNSYDDTSVSISMDKDGKATPVGSRMMNRDGQRLQISGFGDENGKYDTFHSMHGDKYRKNPSYLGPKAANRYKELEKQADDYNNGRSKYIKGKGWE